MTPALRAMLGGHDRTIVSAAAALFLIGFLLSLSSSPSAAAALGFSSSFSFALRHAAFAALAAIVMIGAASLPAIAVRRIGVLALLAGFAMLALVLAFGHEVKGAQRWLRLAGLSLQPAEIVKPALVIGFAWMLSTGMTQARFPGVALACALYGLTAALLLPQPDLGQTALLGIVLAGMLFVVGAPLRLFAIGGVGAAAAAAGVYFMYDHARARIDAFLGEGSYQVNQALDAIASGGVLGRGPGEGVVKLRLPDAQADFIYAAAAEEFGWLASLGLVALYGLIAWVGLQRSARLSDPFRQVAAGGLVLLFSAQAIVHIAVNGSLAPAKGMTLPLVSFGGSALIGSAATLGLALALLRSTPEGSPLKEASS